MRGACGVWYAYRTDRAERRQCDYLYRCAGSGGVRGVSLASMLIQATWYMYTGTGTDGHAGVRLGARSETGRGDNAAGGCIDGCADGGDRRRIGIGIGTGRRDMNPTAGHGQDAGRWTAAGDRTRRHGANCDTPPSSQDRVVSWSWTWSWTGWAATCGRAVVVHLSAVRGRRNKE